MNTIYVICLCTFVNCKPFFIDIYDKYYSLYPDAEKDIDIVNSFWKSKYSEYEGNAVITIKEIFKNNTFKQSTLLYEYNNENKGIIRNIRYKLVNKSVNGNVFSIKPSIYDRTGNIIQAMEELKTLMKTSNVIIDTPQIRSIHELRELSSDNNPLECSIILNSGVHSTKLISFNIKDMKYIINNLSDDSIQSFNAGELRNPKNTFIVDAMRKGCLVLG